MRLYKLHDRLFVRGHTRHTTDTSGILTTLSYNDVRLVVNVAIIPDPALAAACRTVGLEYLHRPMHDSNVVDADSVRDVARRIATAMESAGVMVNCDSGWNRSALVAVRALMYRTDLPAAELIAEARAARGARLLWNPTFEAFLLGERS